MVKYFTNVSALPFLLHDTNQQSKPILIKINLPLSSQLNFYPA